MKHLLLSLFLLLQLSLVAQYSAELTLDRTHASVSKEKKLTIDYYREIRINNRGGDKYAHVTISYLKENKPTNLKAYILDRSGKMVRKLKGKDITVMENVSDDAFHEDLYETSFFMKYDQYPYTLVYSYQTVRNEFFEIPFFPVLSLSIPTKKAVFTADIPSNYPVRYDARHMDKITIDTLDKLIRFSFVTHYTHIIEPEVMTPPITRFLPIVEIVPEHFKYGSLYSQKSWKDLGQWQYQMLKGLNNLPADEKYRIRKLIQGITDTTEKIKVLYHYLQDETRYVYVAIKKGRLKPYPASYVSENKYGDCKALTNYFKSILGYVGIKSYYTNVNSGNRIDRINKKIPSIQFDHIILYVPRKDTTIWLDCTSKDAFGYLGTFTQNRNALVVVNQQSHLIRTPALKPSDVLNTRNIKIEYSLTGVADADFENTYRGSQYESLLELKTSVNNSEKKQIMRYFMSNFTMDQYVIKQGNRDSANIRMQYRAHSDKIYVQYGNDMLVKNIPFSVPDLERPKSRRLPVQINYPQYKMDTIRYSIPRGYYISGMRKDTTINTLFGTYSTHIVPTDSTFLVTKSYLLHAGNYPLKLYRQFYQFIETVRKNENSVNFVLSKKKQ